MIIGVDTGGTFTDLVLRAGNSVHTFKLPSTPGDFSRAVLEGVRRIREHAEATGDFELVHSTTVATNALLERKGAKTGLITTEGFRDVLEIGRQARPELYNLAVEREAPLVPRRLRRELRERVDARGKVLLPLDDEQVDQVVAALVRQGVESLAVCLLFSFLRPSHERRIAAAAKRQGLPVSISSRILPEFREYERSATTVANAYVSPVMQRYLQRISRSAKALGARRLRIVQSNGGCLTASRAGDQAVSTLLSGPAAGVIGALSVARQAFGKKTVKLVTFDMGGTSTDVSLLDGDFQVSTGLQVGGIPIGVPMMDIHTVGAGGGSIAFADAGGGLQVGPESAGADPGPACYGKGERPAVTDANLVLNRLSPDHFLSGRMRLDRGRAERAIDRLAAQLGLDRTGTAEGMLRIVNAHMERAIRVISLERGYDPREFTLVCFGGAGGLHACELAAALNMPRVLVPMHPGVLSAWGAISADVIRDYARTVMLPFGPETLPRLQRVERALRQRAERELEREHFSPDDRLFQSSIDLRYAGQSHELTVPFSRNSAAAFHRLHQQRYGHARREAELEAVTQRVRGIGVGRKPRLAPLPRKGGLKQASMGAEGAMKVYDRNLLPPGARLQGPALVREDYATTRLPAGWTAEVDRFGNLVMEPS